MGGSFTGGVLEEVEGMEGTEGEEEEGGYGGVWEEGC